MYRNTYANINLKNIEYNVKELISKAGGYEYYFGVVKADCYGHNSIKTVKAIINGGCNYLATATLEEALEIRKEIKNIPILCLGIVPTSAISLCIKNNIAITISNFDYLEELLKLPHEGLKVHLKINTGMNRLGLNKKSEIDLAYSKIRNSNLFLEGIYTHIHSPLNKTVTMKQYRTFEELTSSIPLNEIPIVHINASDATLMYEKLPYCNGCRLGIAMYGLASVSDLPLKSTFSLYSEVIQINTVEDGTVGYSGAYEVKGKEKIAVVPIGYADGIIRKNTGRDVYINDKPYKIVGNICMDMLFVKVDDSVKVHDKVAIIKDNNHIEKIANHLDTISYEVICSIGKRVNRVYLQ